MECESEDDVFLHVGELTQAAIANAEATEAPRVASMLIETASRMSPDRAWIARGGLTPLFHELGGAAALGQPPERHVRRRRWAGPTRSPPEPCEDS